MLSIAINVFLVIHVLVSLLIILLVLMQRPKNEGLGAAFGGGMTENLFGAQTTNVLQTMTRYLGGIFFGLTLLLSWMYVKQTSQKSTLQQRLMAPTVVPKLATPSPDAVPVPNPAAPADEKKPEDTAPPAPAKPGESTPAPADKPAGEAAPPPATPAPASPAPATPSPATPAPETPKPDAAPAPEGAAPAKPEPTAPPAAEPTTPPPADKPAEPDKAPEKPGN